jgi:FdhD protein
MQGRADAERTRLVSTSVSEWSSDAVRSRVDELVVEEPLEVRINGRPLTVTMRTPGHDVELATGLLVTEGIVRNANSIALVNDGLGASGNIVEVHTSPDAQVEVHTAERLFPATASCGLCGKASIDAVRVAGIVRPNPDVRIEAEVLCALPDRMRAAQTVFGRTGGLHAAAVFDPVGTLKVVREDIGRHNAVDKAIGWAIAAGQFPLSEHVLLVSGRGGFEIVQKALVAGAPILACVSAPSSLAVDLAREFGQTLVGFLRGSRFIVYAGAERIVQRRSTPGGPASAADRAQSR